MKNLKRVMVLIAVATLIFGGITFAAEQNTENQESTIVGPVMQNRYMQISPQDDEAKVPPEMVQKLMEQGVIPAAADAKTRTVNTGSVK